MLETILDQYSEIIAAIVGGLIGIVGAMAALVVEHYFREAGKVTIYANSVKLELFKTNNIGGDEVTKSIEDAEHGHFTLELEFYSSAEVPKSFRQIAIEFRTGWWRPPFASITPSTYTGPSSGPWPYEKVKTLNLPPKQIESLRLSGSLTKGDLRPIKGKVTVNFTARHPNGKAFTAKLAAIKPDWLS